MAIEDIFGKELKVINLGLEGFAKDLEKQGVNVIHVDWKPPALGKEDLIKLLDRLEPYKDRINEANNKAIRALLDAQPTIVGLGKAIEVIPGMDERTFLHAGPPVEWDRMCGPMKGAIIGGLIYEGLARDKDEAEKIASSGKIKFSPCHHHDAVGPMAGLVTPSMPVWIIEDENSGKRAYCTLNEGLGKVLRYGAFSAEVIERLRWMERTLAPALSEAIKIKGRINLKTLIAQALQMGDECHNRNKAGTSLFIREIAPALVKAGLASEVLSSVLEFINSNDHFFLNLSMPACKCSLEAASGIKWSTLVITMARNGTDFGIRLSSMPDRWFTAPAPKVKGLYFPGYTDEDANPDIGDSAITETAGIGGFAMAAAPAIVKFVGGTVEDAFNFTLRMYEITLAENNSYLIPNLDFRGTPTGIDLLKVIEKGITPNINTGIAHKDPGVGQVGAGLVEAPMKCFEDALKAFVEKHISEEEG